MTNATQDLARWVTDWKRAEFDLREFNRQELRMTDTYRSMLALTDAFDAALPFRRQSEATGMVEQQRYFMRLKSK